MKRNELLELYKTNFTEEIKKWWDKLPTQDKEIATEYIQILNGQGHSKAWIYLALKKVSNKEGGFFQWKMLLLNPQFQWEINQLEGEYIRYKEEMDERKVRVNKALEEMKNKQEKQEPIRIVRKRDEPKKRIDYLALVEQYDDV